MPDTVDTLGIIAGNRSLPLELARGARSAGVRRLVAVGFEGETDPALKDLVDEVVWLRVGQLDRMIEAFTKRGVRQCVMVGQIAPRNLFDLRPDFRAVRLLWRLRERNAQTLFTAIGEELQKDGVTLVEATPWLRSLMPGPGFHLGRELSAEEQEDVRFGYRIAKEVSRLEIGQTVVVKRGTVLAVEGFEGTDRCLARGGELAGREGGAVAVKVAKEQHDLRFDLPCVGAATVETCVASGIGVLAFEPGRALLLERDSVEGLVRRKGFALLSTPAA
jgi:hypothetical protein